MDDHLHDKVLLGLQILHEQYQRREATAWLVLCFADDDDSADLPFAECIVGTYGPFASPEEALVEAGKHDSSGLEGFTNVIVPLYPPVKWRDE